MRKGCIPKVVRIDLEGKNTVQLGGVNLEKIALAAC